MIRKSVIVGVLFLLLGAGVLFDYFRMPSVAMLVQNDDAARPREKTAEERVAEAKQRSENRKGVYMTYDVAADRGAAANRLRNNILKLMDETEINAVVIDVKETKGTMISENLRETVKAVHEKNGWAIARMAMMRDGSQVKTHPEYYIRRGDGSFWRDNQGNAWMDAASRDVWAYQAGEAKKAIDLGFDEIQFDYVRFPSDGNMKDIKYPVHDVKKPKYEAIRDFLAYMKKELKSYKPEIILSADLFGYVAVMTEDLSIGQRLVDMQDSIEYISLMVYPSHYYSGFYIPADKERNLPAVNIPYRGAAAQVASSQPYPIIYRSMLIAGDIMTERIIATTTIDGVATTTVTIKKPYAKMRPWLQDFDLGVDKSRGIYYDAAKVRAQIQAAEDAGTSGWLLWSPTNVYTIEALKKKTQ